MLVLIAMGVVTDVARSKRLSTRDPPLTVVPSPTDPLLVLLADGTVQALNPSLPPCHLRLATEPRHSFAFAIEIMPPLLVRRVRYLPFLGFQTILCSATGRRSLHSARTVSKSQLRKNARTNGRPRGKLHGHFNLTYGKWPRAACNIVHCIYLSLSLSCICRYDLLCMEGLVRGLLVFLGK